MSFRASLITLLLIGFHENQPGTVTDWFLLRHHVHKHRRLTQFTVSTQELLQQSCVVFLLFCPRLLHQWASTNINIFIYRICCDLVVLEPDRPGCITVTESHWVLDKNKNDIWRHLFGLEHFYNRQWSAASHCPAWTQTTAGRGNINVWACKNGQKSNGVQ